MLGDSEGGSRERLLAKMGFGGGLPSSLLLLLSKLDETLKLGSEFVGF